MRLTTQQRIAAIERDNMVLHDTIGILHKLLKQQRELINEYITQKVTAAATHPDDLRKPARPEDAVYTFVCKRRFEKIEKDIAAIRTRPSGGRLGLKAG